MAPDSELGEVYRALGRIEGRLQGVEQRSNQQSADLKDSMSALTSKIEVMTGLVEELRMAQARQRGGFAMLTLLCGGAATAGGLFASYFHVLFHI